MSNTSSKFVFSLSGFNATAIYRVTLSFLTLLCYCLNVVVNVSLVLTIILDPNVHEPVYILLCSLCINGLYGTAGFYQKFLSDLLSDIHVISDAGCLLQMYIFIIYTYGCCEMTMLAMMAYDRYIAVCHPLHYHNKMTSKTVFKLAIVAWIFPAFNLISCIAMSAKLPLCGNEIQKVFCANWNVVKLSCVGTAVNDAVGMLLTTTTGFVILL
ncbi:LOW QUALITY PROTEIN: olfactory receptor 6N1-like [Brachyistius frenatus]|uniref:LOW QUALITY PROTEIN: olfactory receptor 6N1-like n=1 Tax=Brachyistius frenatus TaxID=100188 RepID=UPI0037E7D38B